MRVLPAPDHQEFAFDLAGALQRVSLAACTAACTQRAALQIGRVEAAAGSHLRMERSPESQMATQADPGRGEPAIARGMVLERSQHDARVIVEGRQRGLVLV